MRLFIQFNPLLDQVAAVSDRDILPFFVVIAIDLWTSLGGIIEKELLRELRQTWGSDIRIQFSITRNR
jgi:hypothetical protein